MKKIIRRIVIGLLVILVMGIGFSVWLVKGNDVKYKDSAVVYENKENVEKKALLIYQKSRLGFTNDASESIAKGLVSEGYSVLVNQPESYLEKDLSKYDLVAFGSLRELTLKKIEKDKLYKEVRYQ